MPAGEQGSANKFLYLIVFVFTAWSTVRSYLTTINAYLCFKT